MDFAGEQFGTAVTHRGDGNPLSLSIAKSAQRLANYDEQHGLRPSKCSKGKVLERNRHMKTTTKFTCPAFAAIALVCFAVLSTAQAVSPPPDGGYPGQNTAEGTDALFSLTTGDNNTAIGFNALYSDTIGRGNTATGLNALYSNTTGSYNTANGDGALYSNSTGSFNTGVGQNALNHTVGDNNTAIGFDALDYNTTGNYNTATGSIALYQNTTGNFNTATGSAALYYNTTGVANTANGSHALVNNATGNQNTATGFEALHRNTIGSTNTAIGYRALVQNTGNHNIAVGSNAGRNLTSGDNNIDIGAWGDAGESNVIRIGRWGLQHKAYIQGISGNPVPSGVTVFVNGSGQLGTATSSARFKDEVKPMDKASEIILALKPVTFRYKKELDPERIPQFGLVAEDVAKVNPDLVIYDPEGKPYTVRYDAVNAMLLNEFLKEHRKVKQLEVMVTNLATTVKEQAAQIEKISGQFQASRPIPQVVVNK